MTGVQTCALPIYQAIENAKVNHITPDQLLKEARNKSHMLHDDGSYHQTFNNSNGTLLESHLGEPLLSSEILHNGQQTDSDRIANGTETVSKQIAKGKRTTSKRIVNNKQTDSIPESVLFPLVEKTSEIKQEHSSISAKHQTFSKRIANNKQTDSVTIEEHVALPEEHTKTTAELLQQINGQQTDSKQIANDTLTDSNHIANGKQIDSNRLLEKEVNRKQTESKQEAKQEANGKRTDSSSHTFKSFQHLSTLQKKIVILVFSELKLSKGYPTRGMKVREISERVETTKNTVKDAIHKLKRKKVLIVADSVDGADGWVSFTLLDGLYQQLCELENQNSLSNLIHNSSNERIAKREAEVPSSSSALNISKTTTEEISSNLKLLPLEWESIDFSSLQNIGFQKEHIKQIYSSGKSDVELVQESINQLGHDLASGVSLGIKSPLALIMKLLRVKGEGYTAVVPGYENDEMKYRRKQIEALKRQKEELSKLKEEEANLKTEISYSKSQESFQAWLSSKTQQDIKLITGGLDPTLPSGLSCLRNAFEQQSQTPEQIRTILNQQFGEP